jgi:hypothetical protein
MEWLVNVGLLLSEGRQGLFAKGLGDDGLGFSKPNAVAVDVQVDFVATEQGLFERSIGILEVVREVEVDDLFAIGEGGELGVHFANGVHDGAGSRKDGTQNDLGVRQALFEFGEDGFDAKDGVLGRLAAAHIVGANHEHRNLRLYALDLAILQAPQDILGAVAALAEIQRFA